MTETVFVTETVAVFVDGAGRTVVDVTLRGDGASVTGRSAKYYATDEPTVRKMKAEARKQAQAMLRAVSSD